jgi:hypothetical protein
MYTEDDLEAALAAGVLDAPTLARLRAFHEGRNAAPAVDEEQFRLITGFNDIFVSIACVLTLVAVGWIGADLAGNGAAWVVGALVAATAWGLAEVFTRQRRMALPSILLLAAFVGGLFEAGATLATAGLGVGHLAANGFGTVHDTSDFTPVDAALVVAGGGVLAIVGAVAHWRRYHVPITIAAGAGALATVLLALLVAAAPALEQHLAVPIFVAGLCAFAFAMRWDMSDPLRQSRRSDVAFWLHLLAAPMIVHPIFRGGLIDGGVSAGGAAAVLAIYVLLALVALAIDRRALMVSALAYVLYALSSLFHSFGALTLNTAITALLLGSALLLLSAYWTVARARVLALLPAGLCTRLPPVGRAPAFTPRSA